MTKAVKPAHYYWMWHLAALKVIDADFGPSPSVIPPEDESAIRNQPAPVIRSTVWDSIKPGAFATVALIDTGVSRAHPNLASRLDNDRSIDLTSHRYGAQTAAILPGSTPFGREEKKAFFSHLNIDTLGIDNLAQHEMDFLESLVAEYRASQGVVRRMLDAEETFASHGTACAGLIVGEPAVVKDGVQQPPEAVLAGGVPSDNPNLLPYFGVDPFSKLISIRTSFESDPYQFIAAFLYAWSCKADVIVMPRGLPDPTRAPLQPKNDLKAELETWRGRHAADLFARLDATGPAQPDPNGSQPGHLPDRPWKILRQLILAVSKKIPIVCAAGNDGESQLIYPANLASDDNGIIAVGAVTAEGFRSGYSNYGEGLTVVAPSDDYEIYNRHQTRLDRSDPMLAMHDYSAGAAREFVFSQFDLVSTDLPGVFGYDAGNGAWSRVLPGQGNPGIGGGYYAAFGGTSGASCLIGGLLSLGQRARRASGQPRLDGVQIKALLRSSSSATAIVAPGYRPLTPDTMNADDEDQLEASYFFGAGLPDAAYLLRAILNE